MDLFLAEIGPSDADLLDLALDLRTVMAARQDAGAALAQMYRLRAALDGRHYLAFYRVRCWMQQQICAEVQAWRGAAWIPVALPRDCGRLDAAANTCLAALAATTEGWHDTARVRFRFVSDSNYGAVEATAAAAFTSV